MSATNDAATQDSVKAESPPVISQDLMVRFLHNAHIFAATVQDVMGKKYLQAVAADDISYPQFELLRLIERNGNHQVREIASFLGVSQAAASKNVDKLVRLGLVTREVHQEDRRAVSLNLTTRAKNVIRKYESIKQKKLYEVFEGFDAEEVETMARGLAKVSYQVFKREHGVDPVCMKCSAYYVDHCPIRGLTDGGCIYAQSRESAKGE